MIKGIVILFYKTIVTVVEFPSICYFLFVKIDRKFRYITVVKKISFGQQIVSYESLCRLFNRDNLVVIEVLHQPRNNQFLKVLYENDIRIITYKSVFFSDNYHWATAVAGCFEVFSKLFCCLRRNKYFLDDYIISSILSEAAGPLTISSHSSEKIEEYIDYTGFNALVRNTEFRPKLPLKLLNKVEVALEKSISWKVGKPFVVLF